jgi:hypothetical protein
MRVPRPWLTAIIGLGATAAGAAELTDLPPPTGVGIERGVATLQCELPSGLLSTSRATVLDVGADARADVWLTTAHGLPATPEDVRRRCHVFANGAQRSIEQVWRAHGHAADPEHDWAVFVTQRVKGDLKRWRVAAVAESWLEQLVADRARVRLVLRFAAAAQTDCRLEAWTSQRLLAHTCVTYPGTSGSPLVVGVDLEPVIIGLHVGSQLNWNGKELDMASVARPLDAAVIAAVETAATQALQPRVGRLR